MEQGFPLQGIASACTPPLFPLLLPRNALNRCSEVLDKRRAAERRCGNQGAAPGLKLQATTTKSRGSCAFLIKEIMPASAS